MKRLVALLVGIAFVVVGCASGNPADSKPEPSRAPEKKPSGTYGNY